MRTSALLLLAVLCVPGTNAAEMYRSPCRGSGNRFWREDWVWESRTGGSITATIKIWRTDGAATADRSGGASCFPWQPDVLIEMTGTVAIGAPGTSAFSDESGVDSDPQSFDLSLTNIQATATTTIGQTELGTGCPGNTYTLNNPTPLNGGCTGTGTYEIPARAQCSVLYQTLQQSGRIAFLGETALGTFGTSQWGNCQEVDRTRTRAAQAMMRRSMNARTYYTSCFEAGGVIGRHEWALRQDGTVTMTVQFQDKLLCPWRGDTVDFQIEATGNYDIGNEGNFAALNADPSPVFSRPSTFDVMFSGITVRANTDAGKNIYDCACTGTVTVGGTADGCVDLGIETLVNCPYYYSSIQEGISEARIGEALGFRSRCTPLARSNAPYLLQETTKLRVSPIVNAVGTSAPLLILSAFCCAIVLVVVGLM